MELSPRSVANTSFKTVKKGYDPAEVRAYLEGLSKSIEGLQSQATAMETRARAAVARLQEIAAQPAPPAPAPVQEPAPSHFAAPVDEVDTISRTLLLAQRTADTTVAEASAEARRITDLADEEARNLVNGAQETAQRMIDEAAGEARRAGEGQRLEIDAEVQSLLARREFLITDVDHLELHIVTQRDRLRDVANTLTDIASRVPGGLGDTRRPPVSTAGADDMSSRSAPPASVPDLAATSAAVTVSASNEIPAPVFDALDGSSAMSGPETGHPDGDIEPMSVPEPVTLTPMIEPDDPTWSGRLDDSDAAEPNDGEDVAHADVAAAPSETDMTIGGDDLY